MSAAKNDGKSAGKNDGTSAGESTGTTGLPKGAIAPGMIRTAARANQSVVVTPAGVRSRSRRFRVSATTRFPVGPTAMPQGW